MAIRRVPSRIKNRKEAESRQNFRTVGSISAGEKHSSSKRLTKEKQVNAGSHTITYHRNGYPLASSRLLPELEYDKLCMNMLNLSDISETDIMAYKATIVNPKDNSTTSKLAKRIMNSLNRYNHAMVTLSDRKLELLSLPSRGGGRGKTHKIKLASFVGRRASIDSGESIHSVRSTHSKNEAAGEARDHNSGGSKLSRAIGNLGLGGSKRSVQWDNGGQDGSEGTSVSFALSHLYDVEYNRSGSREFSITFYYPLNEEDAPPTAEYQLVTLSFKADSHEKATLWVKSLLKSTENAAKYLTSITHQMVKNELKAKSETDEGDDAMKVIKYISCCDYHRLCVDLWSIVRGEDSEEVAQAMKRLSEYIDLHGDFEQEASFWKAQSAKIMKHVEKAKARNGGNIEVGVVSSFIEVIKEEVRNEDV